MGISKTKMAFLTCLALKLGFYGSTIVYPASQFRSCEKSSERLWLFYFIIFGLVTALESTVLFPVVLILNKLCGCFWTIAKIAFAVWLYHPTFKGALFLNQKAEKFYPIVFKQLEMVGKLFDGIGFQQNEAAPVKTPSSTEDESQPLIN